MKNTETHESNLQKLQAELLKLLEINFETLQRASDSLIGGGLFIYTLSTLRRIVGKGGITAPAKYRRISEIEYHSQKIKAFLEKGAEANQQLQTGNYSTDRAFRVVPHHVAGFVGDYLCISASSSTNSFNILPFRISPKGYVTAKYIEGEILYGIAGYDNRNLSILIMQQQAQGERKPIPFYFHMLFNVENRRTRRALFSIEAGVSSRKERRHGWPKAGHELLVRADNCFDQFQNAVSISNAESLPAELVTLPILIEGKHSEGKNTTINLSTLISGIQSSKLFRKDMLLADDKYVKNLKDLQSEWLKKSQ